MANNRRHCYGIISLLDPRPGVMSVIAWLQQLPCTSQRFRWETVHVRCFAEQENGQWTRLGASAVLGRYSREGGTTDSACQECPDLLFLYRPQWRTCDRLQHLPRLTLDSHSFPEPRLCRRRQNALPIRQCRKARFLCAKHIAFPWGRPQLPCISFPQMATASPVRVSHGLVRNAQGKRGGQFYRASSLTIWVLSEIA